MKKLIRLRNTFYNMGIKKKMMITNVSIILIMSILLGLTGYFVVQQLLTERSVSVSLELLEQLGANYDHQISAISDAVLAQTFDSRLNDYLPRHDLDTNPKVHYEANRYMSFLASNLMSYNPDIKFVLFSDNDGNSFYFDYNLKGAGKKKVQERIAYDKAVKSRGGMIWQPFSDELVMASRSLFDKNFMEEMGTITIGLDIAYFKKQSKNILKTNVNNIVLLNQENEILLQSDDESGRIAQMIVEKYNPQKNMQELIYYHDKPFIFVTWQSGTGTVRIMNLIDKGVIATEASRALRPLLYIALAAVLLSALMAWLISTRIAKTIYQLIEKTKDIAKGDFTTQIQPEYQDEIGVLSLAFNEMVQKIRELIETVSNERLKQKNIELKSLQFEYDSLQAKLNPHFLYNTLESISSLAKIKGEEEIARSIYLLGNYLRESISSKRKFVLLSEEIQNIKNYIEIQKVSYLNKVNITFDLDEALLETIVPKLVLQPLVENAIVHGIEPKLDSGMIKVSAKCSGRDMVVEIRDDGVGIEMGRLRDGLLLEGDVDQDNPKHAKVGILSVQKRIQILYGNEYGVRMESVRGEGTCIRLTMPIRFEEEMDE